MEEKKCPECGELLIDGKCPNWNEEKDTCGGKKKKKDSVAHIDNYQNKYWMEKSFERTPEGFLKGRAIVTNIGVFTYKDANGTHTELRLPEEVFALDSLESLKLKPVTNDHPKEKVLPTNVKKYAVGSLGDNPSSSTDWREGNQLTDGLHVSIDMIVNEQSVIDSILNGKTALSCGYDCELEKAKDGAVWCGVPYDYIQRNIKYNHVAIVDKARAGDSAKIRLDSGDTVGDIKQEEEAMADLKKMTIDGVEYQAEAEVLKALNQSKEKLDATDKELSGLKTEKSKLEAERDSFKEKLDSVEKELVKVKEELTNSVKLDEAVNAKMKLIETAKSFGVEKIDGVSDKDLKMEVIKKAFPSANLDGKDEKYLEARFDLAVEMNADEVAKNAKNKQKVDGKEGTTETKIDAKSAREKMIDSYKNDSRKGE